MKTWLIWIAAFILIPELMRLTAPGRSAMNFLSRSLGASAFFNLVLDKRSRPHSPFAVVLTSVLYGLSLGMVFVLVGLLVSLMQPK